MAEDELFSEYEFNCLYQFISSNGGTYWEGPKVACMFLEITGGLFLEPFPMLHQPFTLAIRCLSVEGSTGQKQVIGSKPGWGTSCQEHFQRNSMWNQHTGCCWTGHFSYLDRQIFSFCAAQLCLPPSVLVVSEISSCVLSCFHIHKLSLWQAV